MVKSYKGVKSETCCEVVTVGRRCAAEGARIQGQTSPRMMEDGSNGFVRLLSVTKESVELQIRVSFEFGGLISTGYLPVVVEKLSCENSRRVLEMTRSTASFCPA